MRKADAARLLALQEQARQERDALGQRARQLRLQGAALRTGVGTLAWTLGAALVVRFVWRRLAAGSGSAGSPARSSVQTGVIRGLLRWGRRLSAVVAAVRLLAPAGVPAGRTNGPQREGSLSGQRPRG